MRFELGLALFGSLAAAAPQGIAFDVVAKAPAATISGAPVNLLTQTTIYDASAAATSAAAAESTAPPSHKRSDLINRQNDPNAPCAPQAGGAGPTAQPNTDTGFEQYRPFADFAIGTPAPSGYMRNFTNLNGSTSQNGYMGLYTLPTYNATQCASYCNAASGCTAFNLFFERDPSLNPAASCPNPTAFTNIKCTLWGLPVSSATATNMGQYRDQFHVVIAGSDGFNKLAPFAPSMSGFAAPQTLPGAVNYPASYIGADFFNAPFNPAVCADVCRATSASNRATAVASGAASYVPCNYFDAYALSAGGVPRGLYCAFYSSAVDSKYATVTSAQNGGQTYAVGNSFGYASSVVDQGTVS